MSSGRTRAVRLLVSTIVLVLAAVTPLPAGASSTGTENVNLALPTGTHVSGHISLPGGAPAVGADVGVCADEFNCWTASTQTDGTGAFTILGIVPGSYIVMAQSSAPDTRQTYYGGAGSSVTDPALATVLDVTSNVAGIDITLDLGFTLSGTITNPQGNGVAALDVLLNGAGGGSDTTDADGHYAITGLTTGYYGVEVRQPAGSPYTSGSIEGGTIVQGSEPSLFVDGDVQGVDATLVVGASITGTITGLSGPANIQALNSNFDVPVASDGTFAITGLWPEPTGLIVTVPTIGFSDQFPFGVYDGTASLNPDQSAGTELDLSGGDITGLTLAAPSLPGISGTVLDEADAPVAGSIMICSDELGCAFVTLGTDGGYAFFNLVDATYWMYLSGTDHAGGYVTDAGGVSVDFEDARSIVVSGTDQTIDVTVAVGLTLSGRLTGPQGEPVVGGHVSASGGDGQYFASATTDSNGDYVIRGLVEGDYRVGAGGPEGGDYLPGYWSQSGYTDVYEESDLVHVPSDGVTVVATTPTDGAIGVARTVHPSVTFSGSVDTSAVAITLKGARVPVALRGKVSYDDATHTLTFTPRARLLPLSTYTFTVSGLTAAGVPVDPVEATFTTRR